MKHIQRITILLFVLTALTLAGFKFYYGQVLDRVNPVIFCDADTIEVSVNDPEDVLLTGMTATDNRDGDLTDTIMVQGVSHLIGNDTAKVSYVVFDSSSNMASFSRYVRYTDYRRPSFSLDGPLVLPVDPEDAVDYVLDQLKASCVLDGDISQNIRITAHNIDDSTPGIYDATFQVTNSMGDVRTIQLKVIVDNYAYARSLIVLKEHIVYLETGSSFDPEAYIQSVSSGSRSDVTIDNPVNTRVPGTYHVQYAVDRSGGVYVTYLTVVVE